mgnify:CR=1 FL=1
MHAAGRAVTSVILYLFSSHFRKIFLAGEPERDCAFTDHIHLIDLLALRRLEYWTRSFCHGMVYHRNNTFGSQHRSYKHLAGDAWGGFTHIVSGACILDRIHGRRPGSKKIFFDARIFYFRSRCDSGSPIQSGARCLQRMYSCKRSW